MAFAIVNLELDKRNQSPFMEPKQFNGGPYTDAGGGTEEMVIGFYAGDLKDLTIIITDIINVASVGKVYATNDDELHATDPLANNNHVQIGANIVVPANAAAPWVGGSLYSAVNWKWLFITLTTAGAGPHANHVDIDIHGTDR